MPIVTIENQDSVAVQTPNPTGELVVTQSVTLFAANASDPKALKRVGHIVDTCGDVVSVVAGDSQFGTHICASKGIKRIRKALETESDSDVAACMTESLGAHLDIQRASAREAWKARRAAGVAAASATGWRRVALMRLATKGM